MTEIHARAADLVEIADLRERYRSEAGCQIVRDSILPRGLAAPYVVVVNGDIAGYAGIWREHFPGRLTECFVSAEHRTRELALVRALADASGAIELEVQSNIHDGRRLLDHATSRWWTENLLFAEGAETRLRVAGVTFRLREAQDLGPEGEWVVEADGQVVGAGGWLTHYNSPYVDLYMEVAEEWRGRGIGGYLVQELRRVCANAGHRAAARCDPTNEASKRTLERGGLVHSGEILAGILSNGTAPTTASVMVAEPRPS